MKMDEKWMLTGRVAIVTGASKGIGKAIADTLAAAGCKVVVSSRKLSAVEEVALEIEKNGGQALAVACQMGDMEQIDALLATTLAHFGRLDIIVNNAATNPVFGPISEADLGAFDKIMDVNVKGPFYLCKQAYPHLKAGGHGVVINISSIEGLHPGFGLGLYSVSKAALLMLNQVLAKEWGANDIRVNAICPGLIKTKFSQALWSNDDIMKGVMKQQPIKRIGSPEDIANLAHYLAADVSGFCTGSVFTADGGLTI